MTLAGIDLWLLDAARGVRYIDLTVTEALEASTGSRQSHGDIHSGSNLGELLSDGFGNQIHGGRSVNAHRAFEILGILLECHRGRGHRHQHGGYEKGVDRSDGSHVVLVQIV